MRTDKRIEAFRAVAQRAQQGWQQSSLKNESLIEVASEMASLLRRVGLNQFEDAERNVVLEKWRNLNK